ncbi:MAG: hypothetical protein FWG02_10390 [Holophagaceae bacterium]|nr:hypothetical protein [Holophagaceae bacterium]
MGIVSFELDLDGPPPLLTDQDRKELDALAAMPDDEIDCSDLPELTEEQMKNVRFRSFREVVAEIKARQKATV